MTNKKPTLEIIANWYKDPNNWKWGIFYFNKDDKRIFPPKRYGPFGCTINFLNPISILLNTLIVIAIVLMALHFKSF